MTREEWLNAMAAAMRPMFERAGYPLPCKLRISCGWPSNRALAGTKSRSVGQCWPSDSSGDGTREVFISPYLADCLRVADVLTHELIHAALDCQHGHKGPFRKAAKALGLAGKMTATHAGPELAERLNALTKRIGRYPHATLDRSRAPKQGTRMVKVECPACGYTIRTTRHWIGQGLPTCPCGTEMKEEEASR